MVFKKNVWTFIFSDYILPFQWYSGTDEQGAENVGGGLYIGSTP